MDVNKEYRKGYSVFGSEGDLHQIEHAKKVVNTSTPSVGIQVKDGIVLLSQNTNEDSSLLIHNSINRIYKLDKKFAMAVSGHSTDGRILSDNVRKHIRDEKSKYGEISDTKIIANKISNNIQETIQSTELRPYGVSLLIGGIDRNGDAKLYKVDPDGESSAWRGVAIGKNSKTIFEQIESKYDENMDISETIKLTINTFNNSTDKNISNNMISVVKITNEYGVEEVENDIIENILNGDKNE